MQRKLLTLVIVICCYLLTACQPAAVEDLKIAKEKGDLFAQYQALQRLKLQEKQEYYEEFALVEKVLKYNSDVKFLHMNKKYREAFLLAHKANNLRPNKASKELLKASGDILLPELTTITALSPWISTNKVQISKSKVKIPAWENTFYSRLYLPKNSLSSLLVDTDNTDKKQMLEEFNSVNNVLNTLDKEKSPKLYSAFEQINSLANILRLDLSWSHLKPAMTDTLAAQRKLVSEFKGAANMASAGSNWEKRFTKKSNQLKLGIEAASAKSLKYYINHQDLSSASEYEKQLRSLMKEQINISKSMLWPANGLQDYFGNDAKNYRKLQKRIILIEQLSKQINRQKLLQDYNTAIAVLSEHHSQVKELNKPLLAYRHRIRGY